MSEFLKSKISFESSNLVNNNNNEDLIKEESFKFEDDKDFKSLIDNLVKDLIEDEDDLKTAENSPFNYPLSNNKDFELQDNFFIHNFESNIDKKLQISNCFNRYNNFKEKIKYFKESQRHKILSFLNLKKNYNSSINVNNFNLEKCKYFINYMFSF